MKRRGFLQLIGATVAAPMMPPVSASAATVASPVNKVALQGALIHARLRASFSVWGLAKTLGVSVREAEALMAHMAKRGILGPLQGETFGGRWAQSKILRREALGVAKAAQSHAAPSIHETQQRFAEPDLSKLLAHLRQICVSNGMTLHPRCVT